MDLITVSDVQINQLNTILKYICTFLAKPGGLHGHAELFEK